MKRLQYGLIGTGQMGRGHIGALSLVDEVEIVALADKEETSLAKAKEALGREVWSTSDHRELLGRKDVDAVIVATPNFTHADIVCDALRAGKHVLCEKPMATTLEGCERIIAAAEESGKTYQVGLEFRFASGLRRVRKLIDEGELGQVRQMWFTEYRGPWMRKVEEWITQKAKSGGTLLEKNCHHFDLFNWMAGAKPIRVAGFGSVDLVYGKERFGGVAPDVLDNAQVVVQYEDGAVACLLLNMYCRHYERGPEACVVGRDGYALWSARDEVVCGKRERDERMTFKVAIPDHIKEKSHSGLVYYEHVAFMNSIRNGTPPVVNGRIGWWSVLVGLAAERAVAENRTVELSELSDRA